jgi:hypothetical protein
MPKIKNCDCEIRIEEIQELQDREIYKFYFNNESFFETICNEYYNYIYETIKFIILGFLWKK